jgi:hypothetical protein
MVQSDREALQQLSAIGHGIRPFADAESAASGVIGGDDEEAAVTAHKRTS